MAYSADLDASPIMAQGILQPILHLPIVAPLLHVDEVDHN
jgi:hypothetical protein